MLPVYGTVQIKLSSMLCVSIIYTMLSDNYAHDYRFVVFLCSLFPVKFSHTHQGYSTGKWTVIWLRKCLVATMKNMGELTTHILHWYIHKNAQQNHAYISMIYACWLKCRLVTHYYYYFVIVVLPACWCWHGSCNLPSRKVWYIT